MLEAVVLLLHYGHLAASSVHLEGITMEWKSFTIQIDARLLIIYIRALLADDQNNDNIIDDALNILDEHVDNYNKDDDDNNIYVVCISCLL